MNPRRRTVGPTGEGREGANPPVKCNEVARGEGPLRARKKKRKKGVGEGNVAGGNHEKKKGE